MDTTEKKRITIVFPLATWAALRGIAQEHKRSLVGEILWALQQYVQQHTTGK